MGRTAARKEELCGLKTSLELKVGSLGLKGVCEGGSERGHTWEAVRSCETGQALVSSVGAFWSDRARRRLLPRSLAWPSTF